MYNLSPFYRLYGTAGQPGTNRRSYRIPYTGAHRVCSRPIRAGRADGGAVGANETNNNVHDRGRRSGFNLLTITRL